MIGDLKNTDFVMNKVFWLGVFPGLTRAMLDYIAGTIVQFAAQAASPSASEVSVTLPVLS